MRFSNTRDLRLSDSVVPARYFIREIDFLRPGLDQQNTEAPPPNRSRSDAILSGARPTCMMPGTVVGGCRGSWMHIKKSGADNDGPVIPFMLFGTASLTGGSATIAVRA